MVRVPAGRLSAGPGRGIAFPDQGLFRGQRL